MEEQKVRVAIADDHEIVRRGLKEFLSASGGISVVGECSSGGQALEMVRSTSMDVLILDVQMPGRSGIDTIGAIRSRAPGVGILALSGLPAAQYAQQLLRLGASGYLNKQCEPGEIVQAIRTIAQGKRYMQDEVAQLLGETLVAVRGTLPHQKLSQREFQVFIKLARGMQQPEIAKELSLSPKTVAAYRWQVLHALGVRTNSELAYYAIKQGLVE